MRQLRDASHRLHAGWLLLHHSLSPIAQWPSYQGMSSAFFLSSWKTGTRILTLLHLGALFALTLQSRRLWTRTKRRPDAWRVDLTRACTRIQQVAKVPDAAHMCKPKLRAKSVSSMMQDSAQKFCFCDCVKGCFVLASRTTSRRSACESGKVPRMAYDGDVDYSSTSA